MTKHLARAAQRALRRNGQPVTIVKRWYETNADGSWANTDGAGEPVGQTERIDTHGEIVQRGTPTWEQRFAGLSTDIIVAVWVPAIDTVRDAVSDGTDSDTERTSLIEVHGDTLLVFNTIEQNDGRLLLQCKEQ